MPIEFTKVFNANSRASSPQKAQSSAREFLESAHGEIGRPDTRYRSILVSKPFLINQPPKELKIERKHSFYRYIVTVPKNQNGDVLVTKESKADPGRDYDWLQLPNKKISNALRAEFDNVRNGVSTCLIESPLGPENPKRFYDLALLPGI